MIARAKSRARELAKCRKGQFAAISNRFQTKAGSMSYTRFARGQHAPPKQNIAGAVRPQPLVPADLDGRDRKRGRKGKKARKNEGKKSQKGAKKEPEEGKNTKKIESTSTLCLSIFSIWRSMSIARPLSSPPHLGITRPGRRPEQLTARLELLFVQTQLGLSTSCNGLSRDVH